jgi:lysophospholipase L1-like esterase
MKDHVHLTASGGSVLGMALADELERAKADRIVK